MINDITWVWSHCNKVAITFVANVTFSYDVKASFLLLQGMYLVSQLELDTVFTSFNITRRCAQNIKSLNVNNIQCSQDNDSKFLIKPKTLNMIY